MHWLNALLAELSESLVILVLLELIAEFFCALLALAQCPPGRALQNSLEILSATVFSTTLPPEVFNNLTGLPSNC
jgi:hypothetical protein